MASASRTGSYPGWSAVSGTSRSCGCNRNVAEVDGVQPFWQVEQPVASCTEVDLSPVRGTVIGIGEGNVGGSRKWVAFLTLTNMQTQPQMASIVINVEGTSIPLHLTRTVAGCDSLVVGVHALPGMPASANFRTQVGWPGAGSAGLVMRPLGNDFWDVWNIPPVAVLR